MAHSITTAMETFEKHSIDYRPNSSVMFRFVFLLLTFGTGLVFALYRIHRDVVTTQGVVRGYFDPMPPRYTYLGVPYGRPPTRRDRFKPPRPAQRWDGIFEATYRVACPQMSGGDENCLVVNVFTPEHGASLPVLVHVHGGGFESGWGSHKPSLHLLNKGIIFVTFNYRLGALGFLCIGIPEASGNAGLKDQVAALYWVQRNIAKFGGNPLDVTLYGTESGAITVELLVLSNLTKGLFHKVILESSSALSPLAVAYDPFSNAVKAAINLGYKGPEEPQHLLNFYKDVPTHNLTNVTEIFLPCIETPSYDSHSILDLDPMEVLKNGIFNKTPMMIIYKDFFINNAMFDRAPESFDDLLPNNLKFENYETKHRVSELVKEFYFADGENVTQKYIDYIQDVTTEYPIAKSSYLNAVKNSQPVYLMKFTKNAYTKTDFKNEFENVVDFIYANNDSNYNIAIIAEKLITFWNNFIKYSDPTPLTTSITPVIWEPVIIERIRSKTQINVLSELIFGRIIIMSTTPPGQKLIFWDRIYENFYRSHTP